MDPASLVPPFGTRDSGYSIEFQLDVPHLYLVAAGQHDAGSVHFLAEDTDLAILQALATRADGEGVPVP